MKLFFLYGCLFVAFSVTPARGEAEKAPLLKAVKNDDPNAVLCERAGGEFVICDGIPYRKERTSSVNTTGRAIKLPSERRPAIIGPMEEESAILPAP